MKDVRKSKGNVYADLGVSRPVEAFAKAELAHHIIRIIDERGLTQAKAADILGIDQAKVSALSRGRLGGFSSDRLFRFLNALDHDVEIVVRGKPSSRKHARVHVLSP